MAALTNWYLTPQDSDLSKDILFRSPNLYFSRWEYEGSGVYALATTKFTPAVSPAWVIDSLKSLTKKNLYFVDDDGYLCSVAVDSNAATYLVFTPANAKRVADGTTLAALTDTATYQFYVLTPHATDENGEYAGYSIIKDFTPGIEKVPLYTGVPERFIRVDVSGVKPIVKGSLQNIGVPAYKALMNLQLFGPQTAGFTGYLGHDITLPFWEINMVYKDVAARLNRITIWRANLTMDGGLNLGEKKHKEIGFTGDVAQNQYVEVDYATLFGLFRAN